MNFELPCVLVAPVAGIPKSSPDTFLSAEGALQRSLGWSEAEPQESAQHAAKL